MTSALALLRVVVADDDALMCELLCHALGQLGVTHIESTGDGAGALKLLEGRHVDVLLCDLNMPGMDGIELLRHLADRPDAPALVMVSGDDHILRVAAELGKAHQLRVLGTIPKPATPDALRAVLAVLGDELPRRQVFEQSQEAALSSAEVLALIPDALELHFQPQLDLATGQARSVEALARLRHPSRLLGPDVFVPLCERHGFSTALFRGVLASAFVQLARWRAHGLALSMALNVTADDLVDITLVERLVAGAARHDVPLSAITLELTETRILPDATGPIEVLSRLRMRGVGLSIDDYGTGFSSLRQLMRVPFNELKIDQTFIQKALQDQQARAMVASTVQLAKELGLTTVAEGVESAEQLALVTELGCDLAQGYHLARPMAAAEMTQWLDHHLERG